MIDIFSFVFTLTTTTILNVEWHLWLPAVLVVVACNDESNKWGLDGDGTVPGSIPKPLE